MLYFINAECHWCLVFEISPLCWVFLNWVSLCWMSWRPLDQLLYIFNCAVNIDRTKSEIEILTWLEKVRFLSRHSWYVKRHFILSTKILSGNTNTLDCIHIMSYRHFPLVFKTLAKVAWLLSTFMYRMWFPS